MDQSEAPHDREMGSERPNGKESISPKNEPGARVPSIQSSTSEQFSREEDANATTASDNGVSAASEAIQTRDRLDVQQVPASVVPGAAVESQDLMGTVVDRSSDLPQQPLSGSANPQSTPNKQPRPPETFSATGSMSSGVAGGPHDNSQVHGNLRQTIEQPGNLTSQNAVLKMGHSPPCTSMDPPGSVDPTLLEQHKKGVTSVSAGSTFSPPPAGLGSSSAQPSSASALPVPMGTPVHMGATASQSAPHLAAPAMPRQLQQIGDSALGPLPTPTRPQGTPNLSSTLPVPGGSNNTVAAAAAAAATPVPACLPVSENTRRRAPLVDTYSPYIKPTDTSLEVSRQRLRTALEQTRQLRKAFTDRVYEKYRVVLKPVPPAIETMLDQLKTDPSAATAKLEEEMNIIKNEKDLEKKEAHKYSATNVNKTPSEIASVGGVVLLADETIDQLAFFGAGLSLVILPEDEIDEELMDISQYEHRGPTDPETGHRIGGISSAAATAAEVLLDRVRRSGAMRMERQSKLQLISGGESGLKDVTMLSNFQPLPAGRGAIRDPAIQAGILSPKKNLTGVVVPGKSPKPRSRSKSAKGMKSPASASGKASRSRSPGSVPGSSLLGLSPSAEGVGPDGKQFASTAALIACGVGASGKNAHRLRHPYPDSIIGKRLAVAAAPSSGGSSKRAGGSSVAAAAVSQLPPEIRPFALPLKLRPKERKQVNPFPVTFGPSLKKDEAARSVHTVLDQFFILQNNDDKRATCDTLDASEDATKGITMPGRDVEQKKTVIDVDHKDIKPTTKFRRRTGTEIGILRGMRLASEKHSVCPTEPAFLSNGTPQSPFMSSALPLTSSWIETGRIAENDVQMVSASEPNDTQMIDPTLAFSVLSAIGLVHEVRQSNPERQMKDAGVRRLGHEAAQETRGPSAQCLLSSTTLGSGYHIKRPFSEAFLDAFMVSSDKKRHFSLDNERNSNPGPAKDRVVKLTEFPRATDIVSKSGTNTISGRSVEQDKLETSLLVSIRGGGGGVSANDGIVASDSLQKDASSMHRTISESLQRSSPAAPRNTNGADPAIENSSSMSGESTFEDVSESIASSNMSSMNRAHRNLDYSQFQKQNSTSLQSSIIWAESQQSQVRAALSHQMSQIAPSPTDNTYGMISTDINGSGVYQSSPRTTSNVMTDAVARLHSQQNLASSAQMSLSHGLPGIQEHYQRAPHMFQVHHATASMHPQNNAHGSVDLSDYFAGGLHHSARYAGGYSSDWSALTTGLLPTHVSMGVSSSHRVPMPNNMSVRERDLRTLLAREQQQVAAAQSQHRHAARGESQGVLIPSPPQRTPAFLESPRGHQGSPPSFTNATKSDLRISHLGVHSSASAAALLSTTSSVHRSHQQQHQISQPTQTIQANHLQRGAHTHHSFNPMIEPQNSRMEARSEEDYRLLSQASQSAALSLTGHHSVGVGGEVRNDSHHSPRLIPSSEGNIRSGKILSIGTQNNGSPHRTSHNHAVDVVQGTNITSSDSASGTETEQAVRWNTFEASIPGNSEKSTPIDANSLLSVSEIKIDPLEAKTSNESAKTKETNSSSITSGHPVTATATAGMRFIVPPLPDALKSEIADLICQSKFHEALETSVKEDTTTHNKPGVPKPNLVEYLLAVGAAVPIPKALIATPLKERFNSPTLKNLGGNPGSSAIAREVVVASILTWLWALYSDSFEKAFAKSGRIDVDPECKWLIRAAVDTSIRAIMSEIVENGMLAGLGPTSNDGNRTGSTANSKHNSSGGDVSAASAPALIADARVAAIVSEALTKEVCIDEELDLVLPNIERLVAHLDKRRIDALKARSQERTLLAALMSRRATISESFSHAYVSSMVRAGEALGHENLCEAVQDDTLMCSTLLPYDILNDTTGAWEDPCRPQGGFAVDLTGDSLTRRAHARAMIQKSVRKIQDRHGIKGGVPNAGPYTGRDPSSPNTASTGRISPSVASWQSPPHSLSRSGSGLKRKSSFSGISEASIGGTASGLTFPGSATLFNPNHYSPPFVWDNDDLENMPYGRYCKGRRSMSVGRQGSRERIDNKRARSSTQLESSNLSSTTNRPKVVARSTEEIEWADVADMFQPVVSVARGPTDRAQATVGNSISTKQEKSSSVIPSTIFAPFCREFEISALDIISETDSEEEDISDDAILARHQYVLDHMKRKLDIAMAARQQQQQQQRVRSRSTSGR